LYFHCTLQLLVSIAQHLGVNFQEGSDAMGFLSRYWLNLTSLASLFGVVGTSELHWVPGYLRYLAEWWWS